jgi:hypothetical protein
VEISHIRTVASSLADPKCSLSALHRTARTAAECVVNFLKTARDPQSNNCTTPACPPTASAFPSSLSTPLYATSLNRANVLNFLAPLGAYSVTLAPLVAANAPRSPPDDPAPPYDTLVTAFTCSLSAVDLYSRQYLPSPVSRFARAA